MELYGLRICPATCSLSKGVHTAVGGLFADIYGHDLAPGLCLATRHAPAEVDCSHMPLSVCSVVKVMVTLIIAQ